jgi:NAD(P)-dependent dehydrogenase (short-subunit alcohol dehydrogenase family)
MFSLGVSKAAQYNLTQSLANTYEPKGVHVGIVVIGGRVTEDEELYSPKNIAEHFWTLYAQNRDEWTREIDMGEREGQVDV